MTAQILPFPNFYRPASPRDEPGEIVIMPVMQRTPRECPKITELRRQSKLWLERKSKFSGGTCSGGE